MRTPPAAGSNAIGRLTMPLSVAAIGILLIVTGWLAPVLAPVGLGLFLAALAAPLLGALEQRGLATPVALAVTVVVVLAVGLGIVMLALVSIRSLTDSLAAYSTALQARYDGPDAIAGVLRGLLPEDAMAQVLRSVVSILADVVVSLGFAVVVAALLLLDAPRLVRLAGAGFGAENPVFREVPEVARSAVTYFAVRIRVNAVTAVALLALMLVLGVDDALLWAVGAFFLSFVPYIGLVIALIPPTILAFAESGLGAAAAMVIGGTVLNLLAENVLEPSLTGRALQLSTWFVFVSFFFWVWLLGPVGALVSMPISVLIVLILRHAERTRWLAALVSRDDTAARDDMAPSDDPLVRAD